MFFSSMCYKALCGELGSLEFRPGAMRESSKLAFLGGRCIPAAQAYFMCVSSDSTCIRLDFVVVFSG